MVDRGWPFISEKIKWLKAQGFEAHKVPLDYSQFDEETIRIYLDVVHGIDIPKEKLGVEQLLKLVHWLVFEGKTGNDFIIVNSTTVNLMY